MQSSRTAKEFVIASDGLRQEVARLQEIPWPWPSATYPAMLLTADCRMRGAYSVMPQVKYECDGKKACFNHGAEVEASYRALLSELRIYAQQQGQRAPARCSHSGHSPRPEAHPLPQFCLSSAGPRRCSGALAPAQISRRSPPVDHPGPEASIRHELRQGTTVHVRELAGPYQLRTEHALSCLGASPIPPPTKTPTGPQYQCKLSAKPEPSTYSSAPVPSRSREPPTAEWSLTFARAEMQCGVVVCQGAGSGVCQRFSA